MVPGVAVIRQRSGRRGRRRWCRWRAGLPLRAAAEGLLALRPAPLPVRETFVTIIAARGCRAADMVVSTAPNLLAHLPSRRGADGAVRLWWRCGHRHRSRSWRRNWYRCWRNWCRFGRWWCRAPDAIFLAAPGLLSQGPEIMGLAIVRLRGRRDVLRRRGRNDDVWRCRGCGGCHGVHEVDDDRNERKGDNTIEIARLDV